MIMWIYATSIQEFVTPMGSRHSPNLLLLSLLLTVTASDLNTDRLSLLALRSAVGPTILPSWSPSTSPCTWQGVTCDGSGDRVTAIRLPASGLIGAIPPNTVGNLTALRTLSLRFNALASPLPSDLANCNQLKRLYLHGNRFDGPIPNSISRLTNLVQLNLAENNFSGEIPFGFRRLTRLATLYLEKNSLSGQIPDLGLQNLVKFNVSFNKINGSVPKSLQNMPKESFLGLSVCGGPFQACPGDISPAPAAVPPAKPASSGGGGGSNLSGGAIAGIAVGAAVGVLIALVVLIFLCRKSVGSKERTAPVGTGPAKPPETTVGEYPTPPGASVAAKVVVGGGNAKKLVFLNERGSGEFDLEDLLRASAEVLGKGTFGTAYKAVLEMGAVVAVKRLKDVNLNEREFKEKIEVIGGMDHPNLVPLKAYYFSKDEKLLVYDFMSLGSLSSLLHGNRGSGQTPLNWETRSAIALAAAYGLSYIHSTSPTSSHGNIKSSNILLCQTHEDARVSDHGLAHLIGPAPSSASTHAAGYRAPEVTDLRKVSQKADVYSFGVLLLELLTGKAPVQALLNDEGVDLPRWVQSVVQDEWTSEVFDVELLRYQSVEEEMVQLLRLAIDCASQYPDRRPSMPDVVARIEDIRRSRSGGSGGSMEHITGAGEESVD